MIKNIYDKNNKEYYHKYYCDNCFKNIVFGDILRSERAIKQYIFDLCSSCYKYFEEEMNK